MDKIRVDRPFILYGLVSVSYRGRARSDIGPVNLVVMSKKDGAFVIHGAKNIAGVNYQGPKSVLTMVDNIITCVNKKKTESIIVKIHKLKQYIELDDWTMDSVKISRTEKELCDKIELNIKSYLDSQNCSYGEIELHREFPTKFGPVDICVITDDVYHIIEVKARQITMQAIYQVERYISCFDKVEGHLIAPKISPKALEYLKGCAIHYSTMTYDDSIDSI